MMKPQVKMGSGPMLSWEQTRNRLVSGVAKKAMYYCGEFNVYTYKDGLFYTSYLGSTLPISPKNPQNGFRITEYA